MCVVMSIGILFTRTLECVVYSEFIDRMVGTIREPYYERAVEVGDGSFAFSVPRNAGDYSVIPGLRLAAVKLLSK